LDPKSQNNSQYLDFIIITVVLAIKITTGIKAIANTFVNSNIKATITMVTIIHITIIIEIINT